METIFFDTSSVSIGQVFLKLLLFLLVSFVLLYAIYFTLIKTVFKKCGHRKEVCLRLALLWAVLVYFLCFTIYLFILFYRNGADSFKWTDPQFYQGIIPQVIIFMALLIYFFNRRYALVTLINHNQSSK